MARKPETGLVRVAPVPGLWFEPRDVTPEEAAALVASGGFRYQDTPTPEPAVTADDQEAGNGAV